METETKQRFADQLPPSFVAKIEAGRDLIATLPLPTNKWPYQVDMESWCDTLGDDPTRPGCGTYACIWGWCYIATLTPQELEAVDAETLDSWAYNALRHEQWKLSASGVAATARLFYIEGWPAEFLNEDRELVPKLVVPRINHWLETGL